MTPRPCHAQGAQRLRRGSARWLRSAVALATASVSSGALPGCGGGPPPAAPKDVEFAQVMATGRSAFDRGDNDQAALFYGQALRRAEARDDPTDIGDAAYNLAASLLQTGTADREAYARAAGLLAESRREAARAGGRVTDVRLMEARCAYRAGDPTAAATAAAEVAASPAATAAEKGDALRLSGELALDRGDPSAAGRFLAQARTAAGVSKDHAVPGDRAVSAGATGVSPALAAGLVGLEARLAESERQPARAAKLFDQQATVLQAARLYPEMSDALRRAARSHAAAGDDRAAADRWYRAARSLSAQGDVSGGSAAAREAVAAAARAGDPDLPAGLRQLLPASSPATAVAEPSTQPAAPNAEMGLAAPTTTPTTAPASRTVRTRE